MSDVGTLTLTDFLLARIAEDEAQAELAEVRVCAENDLVATDAFGRRLVVVVGPDRVIAECKTKRQIVEAATLGSSIDAWMSDLTLEWVLATLASVYADHPDYREEWKR